jgi:hypothetical protein
MHSPSHFVSRMSSSPTIVSGLHCSLPPSQIPMMGPSSSRPMSGPNNNERCRLHKRNHGDVDLDLLNKNDIWLGQNLVNPSKREELIPFHKVPLEDQLSSTLDNEERLVYCGSCLRYRVNDPLTLNLRYEQKDGVKVKIDLFRESQPILTMSLDPCHSSATWKGNLVGDLSGNQGPSRWD